MDYVPVGRRDPQPTPSEVWTTRVPAYWQPVWTVALGPLTSAKSRRVPSTAGTTSTRSD